MIDTAIKYLGKNISLMLKGEDFKGWSYRKTVYTEFGDPFFSYEFNKKSMEVQCSIDDVVACIFCTSMGCVSVRSIRLRQRNSRPCGAGQTCWRLTELRRRVGRSSG